MTDFQVLPQGVGRKKGADVLHVKTKALPLAGGFTVKIGL